MVEDTLAVARDLDASDYKSESFNQLDNLSSSSIELWENDSESQTCPVGPLPFAIHSIRYLTYPQIAEMGGGAEAVTPLHVRSALKGLNGECGMDCAMTTLHAR